MSATVTIVTLWDRLEDYMKRLELNPWTILKFTEDANTMTARENYVQTKMIPLDDYDKFMM